MVNYTYIAYSNKWCFRCIKSKQSECLTCNALHIVTQNAAWLLVLVSAMRTTWNIKTRDEKICFGKHSWKVCWYIHWGERGLDNTDWLAASYCANSTDCYLFELWIEPPTVSQSETTETRGADPWEDHDWTCFGRPDPFSNITLFPSIVDWGTFKQIICEIMHTNTSHF